MPVLCTATTETSFYTEALIYVIHDTAQSSPKSQCLLVTPQVLVIPVAAAALLQCLRAQLCVREFWSEYSTAAVVATPGCLRLALMAAHEQPQLLHVVSARL